MEAISDYPQEEEFKMKIINHTSKKYRAIVKQKEIQFLATLIKFPTTQRPREVRKLATQ